MPVEQTKLKRAGTGLRALDRERAWAGFTLFALYQSATTTVYLIELDGTVIHTWQMPYPAQYGCLTERGTLFYNGKTPDASDSFISDKPYKIGAVMEVDWNGRVIWEVRHPDHHHDGIRLRNGNVLLLCLTRLPGELARRVQGGIPGTERQGEMYADYLVEMTIDGRVVWESRSWEHLYPQTDRTTLQDRRH